MIAHPGMEAYLNSATLQRSIAYRQELLPADMAGFEAVVPDRYVPAERFARMELHLGGKTFHLYNSGSHHSHGDLVIHQVKAGIIWVSDLAFNQRVTFMGEGNSRQALEGLAWLERNFTDARLMVPGHGSAQTAPFPMLARTRAYIEGLCEAMLRKIAQGVPLLDAARQAEMPAWKDVPLYEENQRANASFVYTELEFEAF